MKFYTTKPPMLGDCVDNYAQQLCAESIESGEMRVALFNDCPMIAFVGDSHSAVAERWNRLFEEQWRIYARTPKAKEDVRRMARQQAESRKAAESFIEEMSDAARLSLPVVALGFVRRSHLIGYTYTADLAKDFVDLLASAGYEPDVNCGEAFRADDADNVARWIIGQAMTMPGHGIEQKFCDEWFAKFTAPTPERHPKRRRNDRPGTNPADQGAV